MEYPHPHTKTQQSREGNKGLFSAAGLEATAGSVVFLPNYILKVFLTLYQCL